MLQFLSSMLRSLRTYKKSQSGLAACSKWRIVHAGFYVIYRGFFFYGACFVTDVFRHGRTYPNFITSLGDRSLEIRAHAHAEL
ncbi:hypothetical protein KC335_g150 [Hortaea werneckii]|nr:hypothetical protein KC335_g150 [Hortaea werneckii]